MNGLVDGRQTGEGAASRQTRRRRRCFHDRVLLEGASLVDLLVGQLLAARRSSQRHAPEFGHITVSGGCGASRKAVSAQKNVARLRSGALSRLQRHLHGTEWWFSIVGLMYRSSIIHAIIVLFTL